MSHVRPWSWALAMLACGAAPALAQEVRYYEKDGVTYRETRQVVREPQTAVEWQERREVVYRERYATEVRETQRTVLVPVTEYQWEPRVHNWWNPIGPRQYAYHLVPRTRWESRAETVRYPHSYREVVPEERITRSPERKLTFVEAERVDVMAVGPAGLRGQPGRSLDPQGAQIATRPEPIGGVSRLENDPPRQGAQTQRR